MSTQDLPSIPTSPDDTPAGLTVQFGTGTRPQSGVTSPRAVASERKRRSHQKSRKGCVTCKRRKVKCGEEKPICLQCDKLGLDCLYEVRNGPASAMPLPVLECSLVYHFMAHTCNDFFDYRDFDESVNVWSTSIPKLALDFPFLLHALFSVTATHQTTLGLTADLQARMQMPVADFIVRHRQQALEEFRSVLHVGVTPQNGDALFATATLLVMQSFTIDSHTWIRMVRGCRFVADEVRRVNFEASLFKFLLMEPPVVPNRPTPTFVLEPLANGPLAKPIAHLADLYAKPEISDTSVFAWAAMLEEPCLELLENEDPAALVLAFYFYNILRRVERRIWWVGGYGRSECERLTAVIPPAYQHFLPAQNPEVEPLTYQ